MYERLLQMSLLAKNYAMWVTYLLLID